MYILDTDHLGILQRGSDPHYAALSRKISRHAQSDFYVTIVSFHDSSRFWINILHAACMQV